MRRCNGRRRREGVFNEKHFRQFVERAAGGSGGDVYFATGAGDHVRGGGGDVGFRGFEPFADFQKISFSELRQGMRADFAVVLLILLHDFAHLFFGGFISNNPKRVAYQSPGLRVFALPWGNMKNLHNPNGVAYYGKHACQDATPLGLNIFLRRTQGSADTRNPGL